eukprot:CAMPEP_0172486438 /NCGR_PEP_ID=MMETSP1066-20121228/15030_1 /TAXON_ID=671091 /ORGANISM="Coscinodiscus wailesii, Strain CCMP2513" /LENGTH=594 /DNA_ID=CAMNT_0013252407 /DNA_START=85 /DNA_END=1866 /DNA_ORIENTATION=-
MTKEGTNNGCSTQHDKEHSTMQSNPHIAMIVPHGYKLRDEFVCPITRELIIDPVIAADGHTYDRAAIEQWLHGSQRRLPSPSNLRRTSPKTGQPLEHMHLIPNHNLKRLIRDMIKEGGESLYCADENANTPLRRQTIPALTDDPDTCNTPAPADNNASKNIDKSPRLALVREMVLTCRCLGPPESDWNGRSFRLAESSEPTLLGGRRRPHEHVQNSDFVQFTDATVSRRHFEIKFLGERQFALRDLGSAGGTFVRIPPRKGVPLVPGTMIMLGKHQLLAMESSDGSKAMNGDEYEVEKAATSMSVPDVDVTTPRYGDSGGDFRRPTVSAFFPERLEEQLENVSENGDTNSERASVREDDDINVFEHDPMRRSTIGMGDDNSCGSDEMPGSEDKVESVESDNIDHLVNTTNNIVDQISASACPSVPCLGHSDDNIATANTGTATELPTTSAAATLTTKRLKRQNTTPSEEQELSLEIACPKDPEADDLETSATDSLIVLRCFAPEGTPIQGREYAVGRSGATLGRKQGNSISFSHKVCDVSNSGAPAPSAAMRYSFVGIDSSISGEHATVVYNDEKGILELFDGVGDRCSTNGTW